MALIVQKYGGTSVGDVDRLKNVADRIARTHRAGNKVVAVVSAMGKTTDDLIAMATRITATPEGREMDMLLTAGERISMSLMAIALNELGVPAKSFTGSQAGIITDAEHGSARIKEITPGRITGALDEGNVVILAGFQGVSDETKDVTTLGRGGSDATAVAMAAALEADVCEIYTDVDGVFTADPRIVPNAKKLDHISYDEMLEMAAQGAGVLMVRSVEFGRNFGIPIHVRSSFSHQLGTWVGPRPGHEESDMEDAIISGVAHDTSEAKVTLRGVKDEPGIAASVFQALAEAAINVDMIVQNVSDHGATDISFTCPRGEASEAAAIATEILGGVGGSEVLVDTDIAKVALVGAGMKTHPGVAATMFKALADAEVNIQMISTSTIRISVVVATSDVERAVTVVHDAFALGGASIATVEGA